MSQDKFSVWTYMHGYDQADSRPASGSMTLALSEADNHFDKLAELVRSELVMLKGRTEADKAAYSETLNRAVLGFPAERAQMLALIEDLLARRKWQGHPPTGSSFATLAEAVFAEVIGLSVLELVLKDADGLEEVQVVGTRIFEVRNGLAVPSAHRLRSIAELERIQQNLVLFNNDSMNPRKRWAEVMLHDGSRVTMTGFGFTSEPTLTIRFFTVKRFTLAALAQPDFKTLNESMRTLLLVVLRSMFNLIIIGPTNSGKTNLMKAFVAELDDHERLITIEGRYELNLGRDFPDKNIIEYEIDEDDRRHDSLQAFKLALRQSPKRICHAEVRDEDANIYVRACTRGHEGSMTSVHVSQLEDAPDALVDLCMMDGRGMDPGRLRKRITEYVTQIGIEMAIVGSARKIVRIGEFVYENDAVIVRDLVVFDRELGDWRQADVLSPRAVDRIRSRDPLGRQALIEAGYIDESEPK